MIDGCRFARLQRPKKPKNVTRGFWCGILGEMHGGSNETRYCYDIEDVNAKIEDAESEVVSRLLV
ncbi:MAG: hypothetical protein DBX45_09275 [Oscillospiraceae bacterium]|nr:MAG: hypothetical protein DBX45_09275 [Oscillospiraceae bacterium]